MLILFFISIQGHHYEMGPIVSFNLKRPDGSWYGYREVEKLASLSGIQLRVILWISSCWCFLLVNSYSHHSTAIVYLYFAAFMLKLLIDCWLFIVTYCLDRMLLQSRCMCKIPGLVPCGSYFEYWGVSTVYFSLLKTEYDGLSIECIKWLQYLCI